MCGTLMMAAIIMGLLLHAYTPVSGSSSAKEGASQAIMHPYHE